VITFEEIREIEDAEERVYAAHDLGGGPILYRFGDTVARGTGLFLGGPIEPAEEEMVEEPVGCMLCYTWWRARYPRGFSGRACPRCMACSGAPLEVHADTERALAEEFAPEVPPGESRGEAKPGG
jgi:hypothetical protein